ncbi:MAG: UDP-N-acetylmuramate--L-alanine ligase [Clostridia bacterium]
MKYAIDYNRIHFVGIGGISMKGLALFCARNGIQTSGSDRQMSPIIDYLVSRGVNAYVGAKVGVVASSDLVVFSAAIAESDAELSFARQNGIATMERKDFLAYLSTLCKQVVAIAGTHGKTSTTAMVVDIMRKLDKEFVGHIGGDFVGENENMVDTGDEFFVTEACEYNKSFLSLEPSVSVILNCDYDHPDTYPTVKSMYDAYKSFLQSAKKALILNENCRFLLAEMPTASEKKIVTYGRCSECDYKIANEKFDSQNIEYDLLCKGESHRVKLFLKGDYNIDNSACALAICDTIGIDIDDAIVALAKFCGVARRFECKGLTANGAKVIVDYAHHPQEIRSAVNTARHMTKGKIKVVFEPHTYSRTKALKDEFVDSFFWADEVIVLPTYSAREKPSDGWSGQDLFCELVRTHIVACFCSTYQQTADYLKNSCDSDDTILILGAGSVVELANLLI